MFFIDDSRYQYLELLHEDALKNFQREGKPDDFLEAYSQQIADVDA